MRNQAISCLTIRSISLGVIFNLINTVIRQFSIIVGFRNREIARIKRALDSLSQQSFTNFELVFIDYGSDVEVAREAEKTVLQYSFASYYYNHTRGWYWNRAHALNSGVELSKGSICLFYDIDLILEPDFLEKISFFDYSGSYYTFSCFYLPQNFDLLKKNVLRHGVHYEQNYVGLCAVERKSVEAISGFDEFYMVWGGEDDDLYTRLRRIGLVRKQIAAADCLVFHQWHPFHSPGYPSMWYLTMVNYLYSTEPATVPSLDRGRLYGPDHRPLAALVATGMYREGSSLRFLPNDRFLFFNSLVQSVHQLQKGEVAFLEYPLPGEKKSRRLFSLVFSAVSRPALPIVDEQKLRDFFEYFIGINRGLLSDYFFSISAELLLFICKKS